VQDVAEAAARAARFRLQTAAGVASRLPLRSDVVRSLRRFAVLVLLPGVALVGCATTRSGAMGLLPNQERLVTLVVTEDKALIQDHCRGALAVGPILGCQVTRDTVLPDGNQVRLIKIVRYTDWLPSAMAFEIDLHELCHAVATLQSTVPDPCHAENDGLLQAAAHQTGASLLDGFRNR
jgi:hypothetical protein